MRRLVLLALLCAVPALVAWAQQAPLPSSYRGAQVTTSQSIAKALPDRSAVGAPSDLGATTLTRTIQPRATRFEGTFTQTREGAAAGDARYGYFSDAHHEITGTLVWTPADLPAHPKTFGNVDSQFYRPTDGEIHVGIRIASRSQAGLCTREGDRRFAIRELPPAALQNLYLEVADDGRYKMKLEMISYFLQVEATQRCTFKVRSEAIAIPVNDVGVVIGPRQGVTTDDAIVGATGETVVYGVYRYSGRWDFKSVD